MRLKVIFLSLAVLGVLMTAGFAQEGHPLVGTWYGDYGAPGAQRTQITVVISWDGKNVTGIINPGPDVMNLKVATLDSSKWTVHLEADGKDGKGQQTHFVGDGKLENIGSYNRTINGTWMAGTTKGDFKLRRDD
jgi:hypothetical protein